MEEERRKIQWKWIRVPVEVHEMITEFSKREKIAIWKVIHRAFSTWVNLYRSHYAPKDLPKGVGRGLEVDRAAWYAFKIASSVGELKAKPTEENFKLLVKTCEQIAERLGIDTEQVILAADQYVKSPTKKNRMVLNDATKVVVAQIILSIAAPEEKIEVEEEE